MGVYRQFKLITQILSGVQINPGDTVYFDCNGGLFVLIFLLRMRVPYQEYEVAYE
jgi:hypothetical protein